MASTDGVEVHGPAREKYPGVLSDEALGLVAELQRANGRLSSLMGEREDARTAALGAVGRQSTSGMDAG